MCLSLCMWIGTFAALATLLALSGPPGAHAFAAPRFRMASASSPERALAFCRASKTAVIATVWPTAQSQVAEARAWLVGASCEIVHEQAVDLRPAAAVATMLALYHGEEWLESNCWYLESPLPEGPPAGPFAGAKWKAALAFREEAPLHVFVVDVADAPRLWTGKYAIREKLRQAVGFCSANLERSSNTLKIKHTHCRSRRQVDSLGNSCLHLTDDQAGALAKWRGGDGVARGGGMMCDSSYAFHCARVLLNPMSVDFLNSGAASDVEAADFRSRFEAYTSKILSSSLLIHLTVPRKRC